MRWSVEAAQGCYGWGGVRSASPPDAPGPMRDLYIWSVQDCYFKNLNAALELQHDNRLV